MMSSGYSASRGAYAGRTDPLDRRRLHVDQRDVRPVVGLEVIGVDRRALGRVGVIDVGQHRRGLRVLHDGADLAPDEVRRGVVGRLVDHHVLERGAELQAATLPRCIVDRLALLRRSFHRQAFLDPERHPVQRLARHRTDLGGVLLDVALELGRQRGVAGRHGVVRGALEHRQVLGRRGDDRRGLDAGGAGADHAHPLAGEIHALMRPLAGVVPVARKALQPANAGTLAVDRQPTAVIRNLATKVSPFSVRTRQRLAALVILRRGDTGVELDVPLQVELVGDDS